jgi:hypothetical protein
MTQLPTFLEGVVDGDGGGWVVVWVDDAFGRQKLTAGGSSAATVVRVRGQHVVHPQHARVQLLKKIFF